MTSNLPPAVTLSTPASPSSTFQGSLERIVAAIDVGTNSLHMVLVKINPRFPSFTIISRQKETVRLGEYADAQSNLSEKAMQRAYQALERFVEVAGSFEAESIVAVATSAVREAPNGMAFLQEVKRRIGLTIDLISGQEEARRIYLGVLSAMEFNQQAHVMVDIGGGSTELILGDGHEPEFLRSIKVGAVRLTQMFLHNDPPTPSQYRQLQDYVRGMVEPPIEQIKASLGSRPVLLVGTSGTAETLATLDARRNGSQPIRMHGYQLNFKSLSQLLDEWKVMPLSQRIQLPGIVERRAEILLAGAVIMHEIMALLEAKQVTFCERALREGLIVDWMLTQGLIEDRLRFQSSVRRRHVLKLANKYQVELDYAEQVASFALSLFDQMQGFLHQWQAPERECLWVAAMLHNCGHFVSHSAHHKHSYYLIRYGELLGFNEEEVEVIANMARYHRKSPPKKRHDTFQRLTSERDQQIVLELSALLRLATALDRRRHHAIQQIHCTYDMADPQQRVLWLDLQPAQAEDDCALELWSLNNKKEVFEQQFDIQVKPRLHYVI
ncbi:MAG: Ppx/GppA phosphatase family protein [Cyanobacteriota bacterium]|nr:Ppx/GppA phosphatase family protein [Cyanobacteriota bacterium]